MAARIILQALNEYQTARLRFVQSISDLASKPHNVPALETAGVLNLLRPLLLDVEPSIQQTTIIAISKMANYNQKVAYAVIQQDVIPPLLQNIGKQNEFYKKAVLFLLRAVVKHSPELADIIIKDGGLETIILCLDDFNVRVKEAAAWALGYIARHNQVLAQTTVRAGAVPLLVMCLQEPELYLKQISVSALCDISKHSQELGQSIADAGAIAFLAKSLTNPDIKLKRQILLTLGNIAKHSADLAESVVEAEILPDILLLMTHFDDSIRKASAILIREICKHSLELAQLVVNSGGVKSLIELISVSNSSSKLPGIMALGYIAGHSDHLASMIITSKGAVQLSTLLQQETNDIALAIIIWTLGQIGKHDSECVKAITDTNILPKLLQFYCNPKSSDDLKKKIKTSLKYIVKNCQNTEALEPLLNNGPPEILKYVLGQFSKILPHDPRARRIFVTSGGLRKIQEIKVDPGSSIFEYMNIIYSCFPEEIIRYYSPDFSDVILEKVEQYQPKVISSTTGNECKQLSETSDSSLSLNYDD
ncbi:sperm-associated antigen 6-like [Chelonus insularis]|uniref:sperm-associated antigen 6-like n=1 Tax=Chelonus insularis TaxID=460826 RepID=UPI001589C789|nr:sperm-associated antigen 6-like [Chelonus insularis]